ncbi:putative molybdenum carrier protein [uncultured Marinobacter sp.]|uniref:putative molybdenum carrier protein n=1 Tax=uncultured Marinobacter sp. TaxID=187379 RepID=UPI0030DB136B
MSINNRTPTLLSIVSGGQTGADRAALDSAMSHGFAVAGYCPKDRLAEDGVIPSRYPLEEVPGSYRARTRKNIQASDGTVVFYLDEIEGGTALTVSLALKERVPLKLIDLGAVDVAIAAQKLCEFCEYHQIATLNVAGPRASKCPRVYSYVFDVMGRLVNGRASDHTGDNRFDQ